MCDLFFIPESSREGFWQRIAAKFKVSLQLHNIHNTHHLHPLSHLHLLHHLLYITYIHPRLHHPHHLQVINFYIALRNSDDVICTGVVTQELLPGSCFTSPTSSTSCKGDQHLHICYKIPTMSFAQKLLHRSSYTRVVAWELLHRSCFTGVVTQELLLLQNCTSQVTIFPSYGSRGSQAVSIRT